MKTLNFKNKTDRMKFPKKGNQMKYFVIVFSLMLIILSSCYKEESMPSTVTSGQFQSSNNYISNADNTISNQNESTNFKAVLE